jgi:hypothetical protein
MLAIVQILKKRIVTLTSNSNGRNKLRKFSPQRSEGNPGPVLCPLQFHAVGLHLVLASHLPLKNAPQN